MLNPLSLIVLRGQSWSTSNWTLISLMEKRQLWNPAFLLAIPFYLTIANHQCHKHLWNSKLFLTKPLTALSNPKHKSFPVNAAICHCFPCDQLISQNSKHFAFVLPLQREVVSTSKSERLNQVSQVRKSQNNRSSQLKYIHICLGQRQALGPVTR